MKINAYIFTTGERDTLEEVLDSLSGIHTEICIDELLGKEHFWKLYNHMFELASEVDADLYIFTPDDYTNLDIERVKQIHNEHKHKPYAFNIINDGRYGLFNGVVPVTIKDYIMCGFVDCGFFCNREALELIGFHIDECIATEDSSGVGRQLSKRFLNKRVPMYKPVESLAQHGEHESIMHKEERKRNPLKSL